MNQILLCFLCGAAFIGGGAATVWMVSIAVSLKNKHGHEELMGCWRGSLEKHDKQLAILTRMADAIERRK